VGQTIQKLSQRSLKRPAIFDKRFVVESCEDFHVHYRNLRINLGFQDWKSFGKGVADSFMRWVRKGSPVGGHSELCRKQVASNPKNDGIMINLNKNLYKGNQGKIFSKGTDLPDDEYIHFKYRDLRLEMTLEEFKEMAECFKEAKGNLDEIQGSRIHSSIQTA
jgi:hypothetical protein